MANEFTTDVTQWQGVDDKPNINSKNIITSDGVAQGIAELGFVPTSPLNKEIVEGRKLTETGIGANDESFNTLKYAVNEGDVLRIKLSKDSDGVMQFQSAPGVPSSGTNTNLVGTTYTDAVNGMVKVPSSATYLIVSQAVTNTTNIVEKIVGVDTVPTAKSHNFVNSGGVYDKYIDAIMETATSMTGYDTALYEIKADGTFDTNNVVNHGIIPVAEGERYAIENYGNNDYVRYAFVTSDVAESGGSVPLVSGTSVISVLPNNTDIIDIPAGCSYLIFNNRGFYNRVYKLNLGESIAELKQGLSENSEYSHLNDTTKQLCFDTITIDLSGIGNDGKDSASLLQNRCRTRNYIKAPFTIEVNNGYKIVAAFRYSINASDIPSFEELKRVSPSSFTSNRQNVCYRLVFSKSDNANFTTSELTSVVKTLYPFYKTIEVRIDDAERDVFKQNLNNSALWEGGYYNNSGNPASSDARIRTKDYIGDNVSLIKVLPNNQYSLLAWDNTNTFVGVWNGSSFVSTVSFSTDVEIDLDSIRQKFSGYKYKMNFVASNVSDSYKLEFLNNIYREIDAVQINDFNFASLWENGYINSSGEDTPNVKRLRTKSFLNKDIDIVNIKHGIVFENQNTYKVGMQAYLVGYENDIYVGVWDGEDFVPSSTYTFKELISLYTFKKKYPNYRFRLIIKAVDNRDLVPSDGLELKFLNNIHESIDNIQKTKAVLTFIDDDCQPVQLEHWESIYKSIGICPSMAVITNRMSAAQWETIERLANVGFDFISHTHNHPHLGDLTEEQLIADFDDSIAALREHFCDPNFMVYPYNEVPDTDTFKNVFYSRWKAGFAGGFTNISVGIFGINYKPIDSINLRRIAFQSSTVIEEIEIDGTTYNYRPPKSMEDWTAILDEAQRTNSWVVIMTHLRNTVATDSYYYDERWPNTIKALVKECLKRGIDVLPVKDAYERFKNKLKIGHQTDSEYYIVDCDNEVFEKSES